MLLTPEWSHRVEVATLPDGETRKHIEASEQECRDLARRLKITSVEDLKADLVIHHKRGGRSVYVSGSVHGKVTQPCTVTLADTLQVIDETFEAWYADSDAAISLARVRQDKMSRHAEAEVPILEEKDDPEPIVEGKIDLGELASQYLALAIDLFPRAEGVPEPEALTIEVKAPSTQNPFAALKKWKDGRKRTDTH
jgi:uncharacterized metal-binding protein YceD (DUF177 family)